MTAELKFSACVDCSTPISERLRCPACHDEHVAQIVAPEPEADATDEALTVPRPKQRVHVANRALPRDLARYVIDFLVLSGLALVFVLWEKGCS